MRTYSQVYLIKLNSIASKEASTLSDADKADLQASLDQAVNGAQLATTYNPCSHLNFQTLGSVYRSLASVGVKDVLGKAAEAYKTASGLNPLNPGIQIDLANVAFADNKNKEAKDYANAALALKPDYIDAYVVLAQIARSEGDTALAVSYAQKALAISPANQDLIKFVDAMRNGNSAPVPAPTTKTP